jgi:AAA domain-containing protein
VSEARLILTCGLPGAGKTTLARQLAADRSAVCLTKDEWLWALGSTPWDTPTREKVERELWHLAQEILRLGLSVVLDLGSGGGSNVTRCAPWLAALVSASNCTTSTCLPTNSGGASRPGTRSHPGTATRSAAPTSTGGYAFSRRPMVPSWPCSTPRQSQNEPPPKLPTKLAAEHSDLESREPNAQLTVAEGEALRGLRALLF